MATISMSGVFSGIDTSSIVSQLMAINRQPLDRLNVQKATALTKQNAVASIGTVLKQFQDLAGNLKGISNLQKVDAASSDDKILTVSGGTGASEGTHSITVHRMATADRQVQAGVASLSTTLGASGSSALSTASAPSADDVWFTTTGNGATYSLQFGSEAAITNVTFAAGTTYSINQVKDIINVRSQAVAGYDAASVEVDGDGNAHLKIASRGNGPQSAMTASLTSGDAVTELGESAYTNTSGTSGQFIYTYNGTTRTVTTAAGTTLETLRDLINNDTANPGVKASILEHKVDNDHVYHLVLSGAATGDSHAITVEAGTTLAGFTAGASWTQTQQALDAQVQVDGYPSSGWIERDSNTITDIIPGATVTLRGMGSASISLSRDTGTLQNSLQNLVNIYNTITTTITSYTAYDTKNKKSGLLQGDSGLSQILSSIRNPLVSTLTGYSTSGQTFAMASDIGISIDKDGKLSLDAAKFNDAVTKDYSAVLRVIGAVGAGETTSSRVQLTSATGTTKAGSYELELDYGDLGNVTAARIRALGEQVWRTMEVNGTTLTGRTGTAEEGMTLTASWDGVSAHQNATVTVRHGLANQLYNTLEGALDETNGTIVNRKNAYQTLMDTIGRNISSMEDRLDAQEKNLKAQYARLEATLAKLDSQRAQFSAVTASANSSEE